MPNPDHLQTLLQGVDAWNAWRERERLIAPDLGGADFRSANLRRADFRGANLRGADLRGANLSGADLISARLSGADPGAEFDGADLRGANLRGADLRGAILFKAHLYKADLSSADLRGASFDGADLSEANLSSANLCTAGLISAGLRRADLRRANLMGANLSSADLRGANLSGADLKYAILVDADITNADLSGCRIYGVSAWGLDQSAETKQRNLIITKSAEPEITVDNIEVAQFIYLLLKNQKLRDVIDTISRKGVLLLGRFTNGRIAVLERLREELRARDFLPIVFNFDKPETKNFTETVRLLAAMSRFVIADITNPRSAPLELQATVPECMIPFVPILEKGEEPFAMLRDLQINHPDRVCKVIRYPSVNRLVEVLDSKIIRPAQARFARLVKRKAAEIGVVDV
jgi:uncharacterized protein YjbI with pentapeptide repeats